MSLSSFAEMLRDAGRNGYAVGSFNAWDLYSARSIVQTAERNRSPVIISLWQPELDLAGERELYESCISFARSATIPVAIFIDHAKDIESVERAIAHGATSVMIDGSHLSLDDNIAFTYEAAVIAHGAGVSIEGEIGILGEEDGQEPDAAFYSDVRESEVFVKETGVDALAIAIGNAHGYYKEEPKLDLQRLTEIQQRVDVPLVLHGGSGIPTDDLQLAIERGITKINIGAEARTAFFTGLRRALREAGEDEKFPHRIFPLALEYHGRLIAEKMALLGSSGRAL
jgi:fructose-bisphosphate aldolase class II